MESIFYKEWRNQHSEQDFPFIGSSNYFPTGLIVDMSLAVFGVNTVYLSTLLITEYNISGTLTSSSGKIFTFSHPIISLSNSQASIINQSDRQMGRIIFGKYAPEIARKMGSGTLTLGEQVVVSPTCLFCFKSNQVSSITIGQTAYSGFMKWQASDGISISGTGNNVVINATGKQIDSECCVPWNEGPLKSINGIIPSDGKIIIRSADTGQPQNSYDPRQLIRVTSAENEITISLSN